jgi:hypothetical protein
LANAAIKQKNAQKKNSDRDQSETRHRRLSCEGNQHATAPQIRERGHARAEKTDEKCEDESEVTEFWNHGVDANVMHAILGVTALRGRSGLPRKRIDL